AEVAVAPKREADLAEIERVEAANEEIRRGASAATSVPGVRSAGLEFSKHVPDVAVRVRSLGIASGDLVLEVRIVQVARDPGHALREVVPVDPGAVAIVPAGRFHRLAESPQ